MENFESSAPVSTRKLAMSLAIATACLTLGLSMPSCPGQQAMQQQLETVEGKQEQFTRQNNVLDGHVKKLQADLGVVQGQVTELITAIEEQKKVLTDMDGAVKAMGAKMNELASRPAPSAQRAAPSRPAPKKRR